MSVDIFHGIHSQAGTYSKKNIHCHSFLFSFLVGTKDYKTIPENSIQREVHSLSRKQHP